MPTILTRLNQNVLGTPGMAAGDRIEFSLTELQRVQLNAAFGAAEGQVQQRGFPGQQHGQGLDFVRIGQGLPTAQEIVGFSR